VTPFGGPTPAALVVIPPVMFQYEKDVSVWFAEIVSVEDEGAAVAQDLHCGVAESKTGFEKAKGEKD
jgi:hypothetical protein